MILKKGMMARVDLVISLLLALALIVLFINGDHTSPRERIYEEKVNQTNALIYNRVLYSQQWFVENKPSQITLGMQNGDLPWNVSKTPAKAYESTVSLDTNARKQINKYVNDFHKWEKGNDYSPSEVRHYKAKLYSLTADQKDDYQLRLNQLRVQYKKAVDSRFKELDKIAKAKEASEIASQRYAESVAASISEQANIAASISSRSQAADDSIATSKSKAVQSSVSTAAEVAQDTSGTTSGASNSHYSDANENSESSSSYESSSEAPASSSEAVNNDTINN
ncbi:hypothetical protein D0504_02070 [Weissella confusa]|uniref:hypothetical protein n=1 Tax=Weissella confusa TaxID=1583 RepID=UPI0002465DAB|nr:hypothetical protein [Weissella confusa]MBJ7616603.1 hypothetical protein [Weissella confusa]MBJ7627222.1 hypothetical protein [Weissella confusa]MCT8392523.1 hypothetical protein [Weissella confusa]CCF29821.1 Protein of unknown function [Weissella confusa LBAE C39-2]